MTTSCSGISHTHGVSNVVRFLLHVLPHNAPRRGNRFRPVMRRVLMPDLLVSMNLSMDDALVEWLRPEATELPL